MPTFLQLEGLTRLAESDDALKLYLADLDLLQGNPSYKPAKTLSTDELSRAEKFRTRELTDRFVSRRWLLRLILAECCGQDAGELEFRYGEFGKPLVAGFPIPFSFSHSGRHALIAVASSGQVGVDIEAIPSMETCREVAGRLLTANEDIQYLQTKDKEYRLAFLHYWTLKEALIKATGEGLSRELTDIEFKQTSPNPLLSRIPPSYGSIQDWKLQTIFLHEQECLIAIAHRIQAD